MEGDFKVWDEILKTIQTLASWPLVILYLALLFRQALTRQVPLLFKSFEALIERLAKVKYKGVWRRSLRLINCAKRLPSTARN